MSDVVGAWQQSVPHQGVQGPVQIQDFSPVELAEVVKVVELLALVIQVQLRVLEVQHDIILGLLQLSNQTLELSLGQVVPVHHEGVWEQGLLVVLDLQLDLLKG